MRSSHCRLYPNPKFGFLWNTLRIFRKKMLFLPSRIPSFLLHLSWGFGLCLSIGSSNHHDICCALTSTLGSRFVYDDIVEDSLTFHNCISIVETRWCAVDNLPIDQAILPSASDYKCHHLTIPDGREVNPSSEERPCSEPRRTQWTRFQTLPEPSYCKALRTIN